MNDGTWDARHTEMHAVTCVSKTRGNLFIDGPLRRVLGADCDLERWFTTRIRSRRITGGAISVFLVPLLNIVSTTLSRHGNRRGAARLQEDTEAAGSDMMRLSEHPRCRNRLVCAKEVKPVWLGRSILGDFLPHLFL
jgi:hypothetical protein